MRASERVYRSLREEIVSWRLPPGAELSEVEQAARWGVSRTPLREALSRLSSEGLAVVGRGRTLVVSGLDRADVAHLFALREALECQAARLAARTDDVAPFVALRDRFAHAQALLDPDDPDRTAYYALVAELDTAVDRAMASPYLERSLATLRAHVARVRRLARDNPARLAQAAQEHRLICAAIADHDEVLASQATAVHLRASLEHVLATLDGATPDRNPAAQNPAAQTLTAPSNGARS